MWLNYGEMQLVNKWNRKRHENKIKLWDGNEKHLLVVTKKYKIASEGRFFICAMITRWKTFKSWLF